MNQRLKRVGHAIAALPDIASSELRMRKFVFADPTLAQTVQAMRTRAPGEREWSDRIEKVRHDLEQSRSRVRFRLTDKEDEFWGNIGYWRKAIPSSRDPDPPRIEEDGHLSRAVGEITRSTSKNYAWGKTFYRIVRALQPNRCLELGTSVGISSSYIGAALEANGQGRLITLEGAPSAVEIAQRTFSTLGLEHRVEVRLGAFADQIRTAMSDLGGIDLAFIDGHHERLPTLDYFGQIVERTAPGGLLLFDDINHPLSVDMKLAWEEIRSSSRVTAALTIGAVGFAVIDGRPETHLQLRRLRH